MEIESALVDALTFTRNDVSFPLPRVSQTPEGECQRPRKPLKASALRRPFLPHMEGARGPPESYRSTNNLE